MPTFTAPQILTPATALVPPLYRSRSVTTMRGEGVDDRGRAARLMKEGQMEAQTRHLEDLPASLEREAIVAELTETIELQRSKLESLGEEVERLRTERNQLTSELQMARAWIRELAAELQRSGPPREPATKTFRERIYA
jgi:chromosome segregation ATPase